MAASLTNVSCRVIPVNSDVARPVPNSGSSGRLGASSSRSTPPATSRSRPDGMLLRERGRRRVIHGRRLRPVRRARSRGRRHPRTPAAILRARAEPRSLRRPRVAAAASRSRACAGPWVNPCHSTERCSAHQSRDRRGVPGNPTYSSSNPPRATGRGYIAYGFRNPFRFAIRPANAEVWVGDVGWHTLGGNRPPPKPPTNVAADFGWPCYEGAGKQPATRRSTSARRCTPTRRTPATAPYYKYNSFLHAQNGRHLPGRVVLDLGSRVLEQPELSERVRGALFFGDYARNCIWVMYAGTNGLPATRPRSEPSWTTRTIPIPSTSRSIPISGDLFYVNISGSIHRIIYGSNQPPIANATPRPPTAPRRSPSSSTPANPPIPTPATRSPTRGISTATEPSATPRAVRPDVHLQHRPIHRECCA